MKESDYVTKLMDHLDKAFRGCVTIKHADGFTSNIPDVEFLYLDRVCWFEVKYRRKGDTLKKLCKMGQCIYGDKLARVSGGRAWHIVYDSVANRTEVWRPGPLAAKLWPDLCGLMSREDERVPWLVAEGLSSGVAETAIRKSLSRTA